MVKYSRQPAEPTKSAKCRVGDLRAHYKNCYNVSRAVKGLKLNKAVRYLEHCLEHKEIIPFVRYGGARHAQVHAVSKETTLGRWPEKSIKAVREMLINLRANAETKGLDIDRCVINHAVCQRAVNGRRRTYRAHGRISPYLSSNCHIEFHCLEKSGAVAKADKVAPRLTKKQAARGARLAVGGK
jgi:large subunit ribosomal protein L17e